MADFTITDAMKQAVITRLATINSATSILSLINGRPAKVTVDEVLVLAERIESWAWRDLLGERPDAQTQGIPSPQAESTKPAPFVQPTTAKPEPAAGNGDRQRSTRAPQTTNGQQWGGSATEKQINAIFAIARSKGYEANAVKAEIKEKIGKDVLQLTSREASKLIDDLKAL
jgi:hypothetical protein